MQFYEGDTLKCNDEDCGCEFQPDYDKIYPEDCPDCLDDDVSLLCPFCGDVVEDTDMRVCCGEMF